MVKNTTGGKKHKKAKNSNVERVLEEADNETQFYSKVNKKLGGGRFSVDVFIPEKRDAKTNKITRAEEIKTEQIALLRGSLRKRARIDVGCIVLVSLRDFEERKVDIIHAYKNEDVQKLKRRKILPECIIFENNVDNEINFQDEENEFFDEEYVNKKNYTSNYDLIPDNFSDDDDDEELINNM